jgi:hypothetical protein
VEPSRTPVQVAVAVVPPATVAPARVEIPEVTRRVILWPLVSFLTILAVLAASAIVDRRPRELKALARLMKATSDIQKRYPSDDQER